jgi:hypothetical protein
MVLMSPSAMTRSTSYVSATRLPGAKPASILRADSSTERQFVDGRLCSAFAGGGGLMGEATGETTPPISGACRTGPSTCIHPKARFQNSRRRSRSRSLLAESGGEARSIVANYHRRLTVAQTTLSVRTMSLCGTAVSKYDRSGRWHIIYSLGSHDDGCGIPSPGENNPRDRRRS